MERILSSSRDQLSLIYCSFEVLHRIKCLGTDASGSQLLRAVNETI